MFFLWIRRNQNSPRIWPNLGQLKPCQEFHNFPNLLFQESCLLTNRPRKLVSTNFLPSSISSPLSHLLSGTCNLTIPLSLSLSLSLWSSPPPLQFPTQPVYWCTSWISYWPTTRGSQTLEVIWATLSWESSAKM